MAGGDLAGLRGHRGRKIQGRRPHSGGQLCGPHCPQGGGGPPRYGLFVQPHLRGSMEASGQRKGQKRRHCRRRPAADPLPAQRPLLAGMGHHGRPRQLPLYHRLYAQRAAAVLGSAGDRQRPLPRNCRRPHRHHTGKLLPAGRQHLPHLLYEPGRHPQGRPHLSGL